MRILCLVLALLAGQPVWAQSHSDHPLQSDAAKTLYVCPMHSHIVKEHPGSCPICGMDLEPKIMDQAPEQGITVQIAPGMQQAMSVITAEVERGNLWKYIRTLGQVTFDDTRIAHIHPRVSGWIEKLRVNTKGQQVEQGQLLFELYSPELVIAQEDFLQILKVATEQGGSNRQALVQQARVKLQLLGMADKTIKQVEQQGRSVYTVPIYARQAGVVTDMAVREGMYVKPEQEIMAIADWQQMWIIADVFESQFDWVKPGKPVEIDLPDIGIRDLEAEVDYIYPELDPVTRSLKVRLKLANPSQRIRPGMTATVEIFAGPKRDVLYVPEQAIIQTQQQSRVIVQQQEDGFVPVNIVTGMRSQGSVEVLSGLEEGQKVVTSGQFLIDSEANLQQSLQRLSGHQSQAQHQH